MGRATPPLIGTLVLLLTLSVTAHADPIVYNISGQIRLAAGAYESFQGSFVLSDPVVSLYGLDDSRGDQLDRYTVSDFRLSSASYSLTQTGLGGIGVWWDLYREPSIRINGLDSAVTVHTSAGLIATDFGDFPPVWEGDPGTQPIAFSGFSESIGLFSSSGHVLNMMAERAPYSVPEPSALLLYGLGMAGLALLRRRVNS